jgi:hypothetical protein
MRNRDKGQGVKAARGITKILCGLAASAVTFLPLSLAVLSLVPILHAQTTRPVATGTLNLEAVPLADALQNIHDRTGLNMAIDWNAIQLLGIDKTTPISINVHGLSVGKALDLILDSAAPNHQLTYYVKDGIVRITTEAVADQDMVTRIYAIDDLLVQHETFTQIPFIDIANQTTATVGGGSSQSPIQSAGQPNPQEIEAQRQKTIDSIIAAITSSIRPEIWKQNGGTASIFYFNGNLIVTAPRSVQGSIASAHN